MQGKQAWTIGAGVLALACLAWCEPLAAASFSCKTAKKCPERTICAEDVISKQDDKLASLYVELRKCAHKISGNADHLRNTQRAWLKERNTCGCDAVCLHTAYEERIGELDETLSSSSVMRECYGAGDATDADTEVSTEPPVGGAPAEVVRGLYPDGLPQSRSALADVFTADLTAAIEKSGLEFDPVVDAQDMQVTGLEVSVLSEEGDEAVVDARFKNFGEAKTLTYVLVVEDAQWKIRNIIKDTGENTWELRQLLGLQ